MININGTKINVPKLVKELDPDRVTYKSGLNSKWKALCEDGQKKELINIVEKNKAFKPIHRRNIPNEYQKKIAHLFLFFKFKGPKDNWTSAKGRFVYGHNRSSDVSLPQETHAPTVNPLTYMCLLYLCAILNWRLASADMPGAFLLTDVTTDLLLFGCVSGDLAKALIKQYPHYKEYQSTNGDIYVQLLKYLYGTDMAAHQFFLYCVNTVMPSIGFEQCTSDPCLFRQLRKDGKSYNFICIHVDDFLLFTHTKEEEDAIFKILIDKWQVTMQTGNRIKFLGTIIERDIKQRQIQISMPDIISKILDKFPENETPPKMTPGPIDLFYINANNDSPPVQSKPFMSALMTILYPARYYRFDLLLPTTLLASAMSKPTEAHLSALKHEIGYIRHTKDYKLIIGGDPTEQSLCISVDAGHASHLDGRAQACMAAIIGRMPLTVAIWKLKHQTLSTWESEISAASEAGKLALHMIQLRKDLNLPDQDQPIIIEQDNQSAIHTNNTGIASFKRAKHIHTRNMFLTEMINDGIVRLKYVPTDLMLSDLGTKMHNKDRLSTLCNLMHIG